jgi:hypothetical protein
MLPVTRIDGLSVGRTMSPLKVHLSGDVVTECGALHPGQKNKSPSFLSPLHLFTVSAIGCLLDFDALAAPAWAVKVYASVYLSQAIRDIATVRLWLPRAPLRIAGGDGGLPCFPCRVECVEVVVTTGVCGDILVPRRQRPLLKAFSVGHGFILQQSRCGLLARRFRELRDRSSPLLA